MKNVKLAIISAILFTLVGCGGALQTKPANTTPPPSVACNIEHQKSMFMPFQSKKANFAAAGAVIGAVIGAVVDGSEGAVKGAVAGGATGFGTGYLADNKDAVIEAKRQALLAKGVCVQAIEGGKIHVVMTAGINFDAGSNKIKPAGRTAIAQVIELVAAMEEAGGVKVRTIFVNGHSSSEGNLAKNQELSQNRANSAMKEVTGGLYVNKLNALVIPVGYGIDYPVASNSTADGRKANRRVEFYFQ